jgi:hypothetical protein
MKLPTYRKLRRRRKVRWKAVVGMEGKEIGRRVRDEVKKSERAADDDAN